MSNIQDKFEQLLKDQRDLQKKFQTEAQELFKEITKEFFDLSPTVKAVTWTQYTPFFNDGDECVFSVGDPSFTNAEGDDVENVTYGEYDGDNEDVWVYDAGSLESESEYFQTFKNEAISRGVNIKACVSLCNAITSSEMKDVMQAMFGDHVRVIATKDGFFCDEFDHD